MVGGAGGEERGWVVRMIVGVLFSEGERGCWEAVLALAYQFGSVQFVFVLFIDGGRVERGGDAVRTIMSLHPNF